jgi:hypothetical protein
MLRAIVFMLLPLNGIAFPKVCLTVFGNRSLTGRGSVTIALNLLSRDRKGVVFVR